MRFEVLGPLTVRDDMGAELAVPHVKARTLLGVLLCTPNDLITTRRLVDALWPVNPSDSAVGNLRVHVYELRKVLGAGRIESTWHGYLLHATDNELDTSQFTALEAQADAARRAGNGRPAVALLRSALELWRGEPFTGCDPSPALDAEATRWREERLAAWHRCVDMELECGRHRTLVPELTDLVAQYPFAEGFRAQLMLALHRCGSSSDALRIFAAGRALTVAETGIEPGSTLTDLQRAILKDHPEIEAHKNDACEPPSPRVTVPTQLPADIGDFTGRDEQVEQVCSLLSDETAESPVVISAIAGRSGVGKTTLALHVAHRLAGTFSAGQLYVNLRGAEADPLEPATVLGRFLRVLGVDGASIPDSVAERTALYRTHLTGRRMLVVLDNAGNERQVRQLLPGARSCVVLITSRARLVALEGATRLDLDALSTDRAVELHARVTGDDRVAAELNAAEAIARLCGRLPLALRIAGARLSTHPGWSLARFATRLADERHRLDELSSGDLEVRGSLAMSYTGTLARVRRALRMLGATGLPEFAAWILCPLLEIDRNTAQSLAETLERAQLIDPVGEDVTGQLRYRFHDLVRVYAADRAVAADPETERDAVLWELDPELTNELLSDPIAWFEAEAQALVAAVDMARRLGRDETAWELFCALVAGRFVLGSQFDEWWRTYESARAVVHGCGSRRGEAPIESAIGLMYFRQDRISEAVESFQNAAEASNDLDIPHDEAIARCGLGISLASQGRVTDALDHARRARETFRHAGDQHVIAVASEVLGAVQTARGSTGDALEVLGQVLASYCAAGDRRGEANTSTRIGRVQLALGDYESAVDWLRQARERFRRLADHAGHAETTYELAVALFGLGQLHQAHAVLRNCLDAYHELGRRSSAARALSTASTLSLKAGDLDQAADYIDRADAVWAEDDQLLWRARTLLTTGDLHAARADTDLARESWERARVLFAELDSPESYDVIARPE